MSTPHVEKHFTGGDFVRDVVIGMADGLTVPFALAAGLSGALTQSRLVVTAGLAEIAAGSIAMGLGGYLAGRSDVEHYASERAREEREIREKPQAEVAEIRDVLAEYGIGEADAQPVILALQRNPTAWADFMMRFELGLEKPDPKRAIRSGATIAGAYVVGGIIPLVPYMVTTSPPRGLAISAAVTMLALGAFGWLKGWATGVSPWRGAAQTMIIGGLAAGVAFLVARMIASSMKKFPAPLVAIAAATALLLLGCGKKGPPLPPLPGSTPRVLDLAVKQVGRSAHATFKLPLRPGHEMVDYRTVGIELWRRKAEEESASQPARPRVTPQLPPGATKGGPPPPPEIPLHDFTKGATRAASVSGDALFELLSQPTLEIVDTLPSDVGDEKLEYALILQTDIRKSGTVSNLATLSPVEPPNAPTDVVAEAVEGGVKISWKLEAPIPGATPAHEAPPKEGEAPPKEGEAPRPPAPPSPPRVNVYRAAGSDPMPSTPFNASPLSASPFQDIDVNAGTTYRYVLRSTTSIAGEDVESDPSPEVAVAYADVFPPKSPSGLRAIPEAGRISIVWNPNEEEDLGGYHVYRRTSGGSWQRVDSAPLPSATFTDSTARAGEPYEYAVTAYDRATPPNESSKSEIVSATAEAATP